jgi:ParB-like chromosome segregation protein Spo0J
MMRRGSRWILLDGAHRVVASHIEKQKYIAAYVISGGASP